MKKQIKNEVEKGIQTETPSSEGKQIDSKKGIAIILLVVLAVLGLILYFTSRITHYGGDLEKKSKKPKSKIESILETGGETQKKPSNIKKFESEEEFKKYLESSAEIYSPGGGIGGSWEASDLMFESSGVVTKSAPGSSLSVGDSATAQRFSETNVQVLNIDEPDVVKTNGREIYYSQPFSYVWSDPVPMPAPLIEEDFDTLRKSEISNDRIIPPYPPERSTGKTKIIRALPLEAAQKISEIEKNGDLLLEDNLLVIFSENKRKIHGYDISDPKNPREKWEIAVNDNNEIVGSRLYNGKIYLITRTFVSGDAPCLYKPLQASGTALEVKCTDIYHPVDQIPADSTYTIVSIEALTGKVSSKTAFLGSASKSVLYVSADSVYITYEYATDYAKMFAAFLGENSDLLPTTITERIKSLEGYDISNNAKFAELETIIQKYQRTLSKDEASRLRNEFTNRIQKFSKDHAREIDKTGIVKIGTDKLDVQSSGTVPGTPLNQFSLDEYKNNLRIATTFNGNIWFPGGFSGGNSQGASDVYILDENLNELGSVKGLGQGERIYSVRFIENKGYVVTFRQTDPFYVLDLANPISPSLKGELKIPGFSSYLHPVSDNQILGIGQESGRVKLSLFDVTDPSSPIEVSKYQLDDYWTEVSNNHHAFLLDKKHGVFFVPGSQGGYILSYLNNSLELKRVITGFNIKRALYINDFMYVIGDSTIKVINENTWQDEKEIEL